MTSQEFEGVNFLPQSPERLDYVVSHDLSATAMRRVGPQFPIEKERRLSVSEELNISSELSAAANEVVVRSEQKEDSSPDSPSKVWLNSIRQKFKWISNGRQRFKCNH